MSALLHGNYSLDAEEIIVFVIATLLLSCVSYYLVEVPFRKKWSGRVPAYTSVVLVTLLLFGAVQKGQALNTKLVETLPVEATRYADDKAICHGKVVGSCTRGDIYSKKKVLVLGDSHAAMLNHFFDYIGKADGVAFHVLTASSCVTVPDFEYQSLSVWAQTPCQEMIRYAEKYIQEAHKIIVAGDWPDQIRAKRLGAAFDEFLASSGSGRHIYLLEDVPHYSVNPVRLHRFNELHLPVPRLQVDKDVISANHYIKQLASRYPYVTYISYAQTGFFDKGPLVNGNLRYMDKHHLNEAGSLLYAKSMKPMIEKIVLNF